MRAREKNARINLAIVRRLVLNLCRLDPSKRKGASTPGASLPIPLIPTAKPFSDLAQFDAIALQAVV